VVVCVVIIAAAIFWYALILWCWSYWVGAGQRDGRGLTPTSWWAVFTMPWWTGRLWLEVQWTYFVERQRARRHLRKLEAMERDAPPGVPPELMQRLQSEIDRLRCQFDPDYQRAQLATRQSEHRQANVIGFRHGHSRDRHRED
jgi:hypothetical protein